eukprot:784452-Ditylum_brightwellii.AAC.1
MTFDLARVVEKYQTNSQKLEDNKIDVQTKLKNEKSRRFELEEHFAQVDRNLAITTKEEDLLMNVQKLEDEAMRILIDPCIHLQRLFRGKRDRVIVAKLRQKKTKGRKTKGKPKKKK